MQARAEPGFVTTVVGALGAAGVLVDGLDVRKPSLDDVFVDLTGRPADQPPPDDPPEDRHGDEPGDEPDDEPDKEEEAA